MDRHEKTQQREVFYYPPKSESKFHNEFGDPFFYGLLFFNRKRFAKLIVNIREAFRADKFSYHAGFLHSYFDSLLGGLAYMDYKQTTLARWFHKNGYMNWIFTRRDMVKPGKEKMQTM